MATLRIVNEKEDITHVIDGYVAPFIIEQGLDGYVFFNKNISQETKAIYDDFFAKDAEIVAVRYVGGTFKTSDWVKTVATFGFYAIYKAYKSTQQKGPRNNLSTETSSNNTLGGRGNEQRLGKRIEDIWGNDPKIFPSILSTFTRFDSNKNEVECSILCAGVGNLSLIEPKDNDYLLSDIPSTAAAVYQKFPTDTFHATLGGSDFTPLTTTGIQFSPLAVKKNTTISGFELKVSEVASSLVFCSADVVNNGEIVYFLVSPDNPPNITVVSRSGGTATITLQSGVYDFIAAGYATTQNVTFTGLAYRTIDGVNYNNCEVITSVITSVSTDSFTADITYAAGGKFWDVLPLGIGTTSVFGYDPIFDGYDRLAANTMVCSITNSVVTYSPITNIDFGTKTSASYLCNFECPNGTSTTNVAKLRVYT